MFPCAHHWISHFGIGTLDVPVHSFGHEGKLVHGSQMVQLPVEHRPFAVTAFTLRGTNRRQVRVQVILIGHATHVFRVIHIIVILRIITAVVAAAAAAGLQVTIKVSIFLSRFLPKFSTVRHFRLECTAQKIT